MAIITDTYDHDDFTTYTVKGVGVGPYTWTSGRVFEREDSFTTHRQDSLIAGDVHGEVTVMVLGTLAGSDKQEKGYVHAKFTAQQAREIAETLLAAAREHDESKQREEHPPAKPRRYSIHGSSLARETGLDRPFPEPDYKVEV